ncbi:DUF3298 domain-containing protein [Glaesserella parasuis]|uniref:DUF3298 and DUF4163 domain-containing protein n=1 Tax=Glaesserella parasuis TaxID=738 RepID=UPI002436FD25|nr:DUF3298 and DUF4163 domain-containing protein [Glaesserella parasuis]MDG6828962.1 DUF3298 domain-containing protein [Glaesserella parasuis]MDO9927143.1 DUF3298 domain-containing protein [Glaesserella parasuis]MDO9931625.1 DUF3298 domain-containing protein [Glaesserella parasuis]MDO9982694.1 DUF3298 domain-containing protein [Glaesserella parasuis]MDP0020787.1 DUF3298 domain-containing protein [Glaesserella parasuis]
MFFLSACDDKEKNTLAAQVQQSAQEIFQLKSELEKAKSAFPTLKVEIETLFDKKEVVKHKKDPNESDEFFREKTPVHLGITLPKTNIEWLDALIYHDFIQNWSGEFDAQGNKISPPKVEKGKELEMVLKAIQKQFDVMIAEAKEYPAIGYTEVMNSNYVYQRNNLVVFSQFYNIYTGGAHGMYSTRYLNIDTDKQAIIKLVDLLSEKEQAALKETLWNRYVGEWMLLSGGNSEPFTAKAELIFSDEFYFSESGITFVYPPYALGPFVMGEVELTLYWSEINEFLPKEYQGRDKYIEADL